MLKENAFDNDLIIDRDFLELEKVMLVYRPADESSLPEPKAFTQFLLQIDAFEEPSGPLIHLVIFKLISEKMLEES